MRGRARRLAGLLRLPPRVALFQLRAHLHATRAGDDMTLASSTRPADLRALLRLARHRRSVVELGTWTGWTAVSLALADPGRRVVALDPVTHPRRAHYVALAPASARERIRFVEAPGAEVPDDAGPVDLLFVDTAHERDATLDEFEAWRPHLAPGAVVVFDDYAHPDFPGVREAVERLGLEGEIDGTMFVWRAPAA